MISISILFVLAIEISFMTVFKTQFLTLKIGPRIFQKNKNSGKNFDNIRR